MGMIGGRNLVCKHCGIGIVVDGVFEGAVSRGYDKCVYVYAISLCDNQSHSQSLIHQCHDQSLIYPCLQAIIQNLIDLPIQSPQARSYS